MNGHRPKSDDPSSGHSPFPLLEAPVERGQNPPNRSKTEEEESTETDESRLSKNQNILGLVKKTVP